MIYTCTTNPSLDYYIALHDVEVGIDNRSLAENYEAGGKGVNVSIVLNNFCIPNTCLGFLGGFTKEYYLSFLTKYPNIQPLFTTIKDNTRINLKIMDDRYETGINARGPVITDEEFEKFRTRLLNIYNGDIFVLSGNIEDEIKDKMIDLVHELVNDGVKVILDTDRSIMDRCLDTELFAVKLNDNNRDTGTDIKEYGKSLVEKGVQYVLYSAPDQDSYIFSEDCCLTYRNDTEKHGNATGSADSMVAGFIYGVIRAADTVESFRYANAASIANTMSEGMGSREEIEKVFDTIEVTKI